MTGEIPLAPAPMGKCLETLRLCEHSGLNYCQCSEVDDLIIILQRTNSPPQKLEIFAGKIGEI